MTNKRYERLVEQIRKLPADTVLAIAGHCDGHSIFEPRAFLEAGLPTPVVDYLTRRYRSDGTPKGTLFAGGAAVKELTGVYGLEVLRFLVRALNIPYRQAIGRGFEAQNIQTAIRAHFSAADGSDAQKRP